MSKFAGHGAGEEQTLPPGFYGASQEPGIGSLRTATQSKVIELDASKIRNYMRALQIALFYDRAS